MASSSKKRATSPSTPAPIDNKAVDSQAVDIKAVLSAAMHRAPPDDLADRVMSRVNLVETVANFATLVGLVPAKAATASFLSAQETRADDDEPSHQDE